MDFVAKFEGSDFGVGAMYPVGAIPIEYSQKRASESGRHFRGSLEYMGWGEQEIRLILRARSPYISMHPFSDLTATGSRNKRLYKASKPHA